MSRRLAIPGGRPSAVSEQRLDDLGVDGRVALGLAGAVNVLGEPALALLTAQNFLIDGGNYPGTF